MIRTKNSKLLNWICAILVVLFIGSVVWGFYLKIQGNDELGNKYIGVGVLIFTFLLLPVFLVYRWRGKRLKDYTITKENIDRMREEGID